VRPSEADTEYVPTQVLTEFIRFHPNYRIDGLIFKSAMKRDGANIVLFRGHDISTEDKRDNDAWLLYQGCQRYVITAMDFEYKQDEGQGESA